MKWEYGCKCDDVGVFVVLWMVMWEYDSYVDVDDIVVTISSVWSTK